MARSRSCWRRSRSNSQQSIRVARHDGLKTTSASCGVLVLSPGARLWFTAAICIAGCKIAIAGGGRGLTMMEEIDVRVIAFELNRLFFGGKAPTRIKYVSTSGGIQTIEPGVINPAGFSRPAGQILGRRADDPPDG